MQGPMKPWGIGKSNGLFQPPRPPTPCHTRCQGVARGTPCQRIEKGPITSAWFPAGLVLELENILGQRIDIVTETALNPYLRDHVRREAVPL